MAHKLIAVLAWVALGLIVVVTLSRIGLRPETGSVRLERFVAYGLLGALFVAAYPRHFALVMSFILAVAISLELLQHLTPDRHGHITDAMQKIGGGVAGCSIVRLVQVWRERTTEKVLMTVRIIRHSIVSDCGSFEVRFSDGRPSVLFYWDDILSRRLGPEQVDQETAKKQAQEFARSVSEP
ncbi:hypothetical protein ACVW1A_007110 [Bradyrhizobium sp. LB1.3]|uniref:VanZ family protein n=1 Tax=Bradyrhizobium sp. LB12.1 TaxID=3156327 RepID=UPI00339A22DF